MNAYVEIVDENLASIIKQNFIFQTQLKLSETKIAQLEDVKKQYDLLVNQNKDLSQKVNDLTNLTSSYRTIDEDKGRLQVALNESSQTKNQLQSELNSANQELARLRSQVGEIDKLRAENNSLKEELTPKTSIKKQDKPADKAQNSKATAGTF